MTCRCAWQGNPFGVDRQFIAKELGFVGGVCPNSMDAVSDRDYVLDTLYFASGAHDSPVPLGGGPHHLLLGALQVCAVLRRICNR